MLLIERSGYYAWLKRKPGKRATSNAILDKEITTIFNKHKNRYGSVRIKDELYDDGVICSKNRVAKRMKHLGLRVCILIETNAYSSIKPNTNSGVGRTLIPELRERVAQVIYQIIF